MSTDNKEKSPSLGAAHTNLDDYKSGENIDLIRRRQAHFGGSLLFYHDPLNIVRGEGVFLYDQHDNAFLDCYNNVPSVGHCNLKVVKALTEQAAVLNTHTRYLSEGVINYAEALAARFPDPLDVCLFVCTGTEANELAMRIARAVTGNTGGIVMEYSYHGNSTLIAEMSTLGYSKDKRPDHICAVEPPNLYRGPFNNEDGKAAQHYAGLVDEAIATLDSRGLGTAAFMCDTIFDSQGGLEAPADYFKEVYARVRATGGLCIADEVQPGFARTGKMWGFENYDVIPDIVTLGKPMGNGHPLAGVVTTRAIMEKFATSEFYFNTFGGNPVSSAAGQAVLDEIQDRDLTSHVQATGQYLRQSLERFAEMHELVGNIHGIGLYQAIELVKDRETREPDAESASKIPDLMKEQGVLIGQTGRRGNILKIRPPLVFDRDNVDQLMQALENVFEQM